MGVESRLSSWDNNSQNEILKEWKLTFDQYNQIRRKTFLSPKDKWSYQVNKVLNCLH